MRDAFSNALVRLAKADPRVLLLTGDHGYALFDAFRRECPAQYINAGIAEQNMVGMAAGLARAGFIPFVYGLSAFIPVRVLEQIKLDIAHDNLHVVLLGDGAGFVYSSLGTSHQSTEDIACVRAVPNMMVLSPADRHEQTLAMEWAYEAKAPVYLRMGKSDRGGVHPTLPSAAPGDVLCVRRGQPRGVKLVATGSMVKTALELAESTYTDMAVFSVPTLKPLNQDHLSNLVSEARALITLEEHSTMGGLGSLVAEWTALHHPIHVMRIGVKDRFSHYCGTYQYLLEEHGLDPASVRRDIDAFLARLTA